MATVTTQERTNILKLVAGMFNAAPGAAYLNEFTDAYVAMNKDLGALAAGLGQTGAFQSLYPSFLTADEFANKFLDTLGLKANTEAQDWVKAKVNAGENFASVAFQALVAIDASTAAEFKAAKDQLDNKATVAEHYSVTLQASSNDLAALQNVVAKVTADPKSVEAANDANQGGSGKTFTLTTNPDTWTGTSGNDVFTAAAVNQLGQKADTLQAFDSIDGGAGNDTLNIYVSDDGTSAFNAAQVGTIKNIETINIDQNEAVAARLFTGGTVDASKFEGATAVNQIAKAGSVKNLAATTTAGFVNTAQAPALSVTAAAAATSASVALTNAADANLTDGNVVALNVAGAALNAVNVSGTIAAGTNTPATQVLNLGVTAGKDVATLTVNAATAATLAVTRGTGSTKDITTLDASGSTAGVTFNALAAAPAVTGGTAGSLATVKTGAGNDTVGIATATTATLGALVESGAGNDTVNVKTTGAGTTTINAGDGNDTVDIQGRSTGVLNINLGAGNDSFKVTAGAINGTDIIDGGEGVDTLLLSVVGAANIGAFQNFEVFDAKGLAKTLDVDILSSKNTVTEIVASGDVGTKAELTNLGAGVGYRATADVDTTNALTLTQKTAGALTVTLDADSTSTTAQNDTEMAAVASNATSLTAVFAVDSGYNDPTVNTNDQTIVLEGTTATTLDVVSGGTNATNILTYTSGDNATTGKGDVLTAITITGNQALSVTITETDASEVVTIDASALTGALTISTGELKAESATGKFDGGTLTLGGGADVVTITTGAKKVGNIGKGTEKGATKQGDFDVFTTGSAVAVNADVSATTGVTYSIKDGVFKFEGSGPATLTDAITAVDTAVGTAGNAVVFEYIGNSYLFVDGGPVVQLVGVTGLNGLAEIGTTDNLYVI